MDHHVSLKQLVKYMAIVNFLHHEVDYALLNRTF